MVQNADNNTCCGTAGEVASCCKVEALVSVDDRGQMVLPKDIRDRAGIRPGDKLAVVGTEQDGKLCCITLVKADDLTGMIKSMLGPMMKDLF